MGLLRFSVSYTCKFVTGYGDRLTHRWYYAFYILQKKECWSFKAALIPGHSGFIIAHFGCIVCNNTRTVHCRLHLYLPLHHHQEIILFLVFHTEQTPDSAA